MTDIQLTTNQDHNQPADLGFSSSVNQDTSIKVFSVEKTLEELTERFPKVLELFETVGIHPTKSDKPFNPYTRETATESFRNIGEHCLAVAYVAAKIMDALAEAGVLSGDDADFVTERALVHDITKPYEIMRRDAERDGLTEEVYTVSAYEKLKPLLTSNGIPEHLAEYLIDAGRETGHNSLKDFIVSDGEVTELKHGLIAKEIVHLADDMTFTSNPLKSGDAPITLFLTPWERMLASRFIEKYPFLWEEGLGVADSGEIVTVRDVNQPGDGVKVIGDYAALQVKVATAIARKFQLFLEPDSKLAPEHFIKQLVNG